MNNEVDSKSGTFFVKRAIEFFAYKIANSKNLKKYTEVDVWKFLNPKFLQKFAMEASMMFENI